METQRAARIARENVAQSNTRWPVEGGRLAHIVFLGRVEWHWPRRSGRSQGRLQGSRAPKNRAHHSAHHAVGRKLRHRRRHGHSGIKRLPSPVQIHWQANQADAQHQPAEADAGKYPKAEGGGTEQPGERVALSVNFPGARRRASASPATRKRPVGVPPAC